MDHQRKSGETEGSERETSQELEEMTLQPEAVVEERGKKRKSTG